jgi:hypothetical protein
MVRFKIVDQYDSSFTLDPEAKTALFALLTHETFLKQIGQTQSDLLSEGRSQHVEFTGLLFQPVPYTPTATKGMPVEYEQYHDSPDYVIINVPPNFMFKAKVFQPSRLCAIYRKINQESSN